MTDPKIKRNISDICSIMIASIVALVVGTLLSNVFVGSISAVFSAILFTIIKTPQ